MPLRQGPPVPALFSPGELRGKGEMLKPREGIGGGGGQHAAQRRLAQGHLTERKIQGDEGHLAVERGNEHGGTGLKLLGGGAFERLL